MRPTNLSLPKTPALFPALLWLALMVTWPLTAQAMDRYVDGAGTCGSNTPCYTTIQEAITESENGDVIRVYDGTYDYIELVAAAAPENLTIQAVNPGGPTIELSGAGEQAVIYVEDVSGTTIDGFNLVRSGTGGTGAGVFAFNNTLEAPMEVTIRNCSMSGEESFRAGVRLRGCVSAEIIGNTISGARDAGIATSVGLDLTPPNEDVLSGNPTVTIQGNTIDGTISGASESARAGIFLKGDTGNTAQVTIGGSGGFQNIIRDNGTAGIRLEDIYGLVTIDNNDISNNAKAGICLVDVGSQSAFAAIKNNDIHYNTEAGVNIAGATYLTVGPGKNNIYKNGSAGVAFNKDRVTALYSDPVNASSGPVTIEGNKISTNDRAGIVVADAVAYTVTVRGNDISDNKKAGICIQNNCTLEILENNIRNQSQGGIHTGKGNSFAGTPGDAVLTVRQNKIHNNGGMNKGAGMDVPHASGTIENNLVYDNHMAGIRFENHITAILNNTVVGNGQNGNGGGIVYDKLGGSNTADGTLSDSPNFPEPLIRNNICAFNERAGLRTGYMDVTGDHCPENPTTDPEGEHYRDYNLLYANNQTGATDCGWESGSYVRSCVEKNYGGCGLTVSLPWEMRNPHDVIADPEFNMAAGDYSLDTNSPAIGAGLGGVDMGAYGGDNSIGDADIPDFPTPNL